MKILIIILIILVVWFSISIIPFICLYIKNRPTKNIKVEKSCQGCKYLDFYFEGSPFCIRGLDSQCTKLEFKFKEPK